MKVMADFPRRVTICFFLFFHCSSKASKPPQNEELQDKMQVFFKI